MFLMQAPTAQFQELLSKRVIQTKPRKRGRKLQRTGLKNVQQEVIGEIDDEDEQ